MNANADGQSLPPREAVAQAIIDHLLHIEEELLRIRQLVEEFVWRTPHE
jgi:hypothetical protein